MGSVKLYILSINQNKLLKKYITITRIQQRYNVKWILYRSDPHTKLLNISDKMTLKRSDKYFALSNLGIY